MIEETQKLDRPLIPWFESLVSELEVLGETYSNPNIDPVDVMELYYDNVSPKNSALALVKTTKPVYYKKGVN